MNKLISLLLLFISANSFAQNKIDSVRIVFDKNGNQIIKQYYSTANPKRKTPKSTSYKNFAATKPKH